MKLLIDSRDGEGVALDFNELIHREDIQLLNKAEWSIKVHENLAIQIWKFDNHFGCSRAADSSNGLFWKLLENDEF